MPYARVKNELPIIPGYAAGDIVSISDAFPGAPVNTLTAGVSGRGCNVTRTGKNLFGHEPVTISMATYVFNNEPLFLKAGNYTFSFEFNGSSNSSSFRIDNEDGNSIFTSTRTIENGLNYITISLPQDGYFLKYYSNAIGTFSNFQIEIGITTNPEYEPYTGTTYPITFPSSVSDGSIKIYSDGSVDLTSEGTTTRLTDTAQVTTTSGLNNIWVDTGDIESLIYIRRNDS